MRLESGPKDREFELIAVIPSPHDHARLRSALFERRAQLLDEMVTSPTGCVTIMAVIGSDGRADIFISRNQAEEILPPLSAVTAALQQLLASGPYHPGALLVLGRQPEGSVELGGAYPQLLARLQSSPSLPPVDQCVRGIVGVAGQRQSLMSTLLWWELGRATAAKPSLLTLHALNRARSAFSILDAGWQAQRARSAAREVEGAIQLELFDKPESVDIQPLRYELVPTYYASGYFESDEQWAIARDTHSAGWRAVDQVQLTLGLDDGADFEGTALGMKSSALAFNGQEYELQISVDFLPRIHLDLDSMSNRNCIRYFMDGEVISSGMQVINAPAGAPVSFILNKLPKKGAKMRLTCLSNVGQIARFIIQITDQHRGDDGGGVRICKEGESLAAIA